MDFSEFIAPGTMDDSLPGFTLPIGSDINLTFPVNFVRSLVPREKRLLVVVFALVLLVKFTPSVLKNTQSQNLEVIRSHISRTHSQWQEFQRQNAGFESVHFFSHTGGEGMFGAYGEVPSDSHVAALQRFMESTLPPRPVYLKLIQVKAPERTELSPEGKNPEVVHPTSGLPLEPAEKKRKATPVVSRR